MTRDRSTGIVALVHGTVIAALTLQLPDSTIAGDVGPRVFPFISGGLLILCGAGLLVNGKSTAEGIFTKKALGRLGLIFGVVLAYCVGMAFLGFIVPTVLVLFVLSTMFAEGKDAALWKRALYAVVITAIVYFLFHNVLNLKLPTNQLF